jgi:hypothetical protein
LLTPVVGGLALITPFDLGGRGLRYLAAAVVATVAAWGVCVDGSVTPVEGAGLVILYGLLVAGSWWYERDVPAIGELSELHGDDDDGHTRRSPGSGCCSR